MEAGLTAMDAGAEDENEIGSSDMTCILLMLFLLGYIQTDHDD